MNKNTTLEEQKQVIIDKKLQEIDSIIEKLDFLDIQILRKFYATDREFPFNTQPYCFPILYHEMKTTQHLKIGAEALRKRLNKLVELGFLKKIKYSNPVSYLPVDGKENYIKSIIVRFFLIHGLSNFVKI